MVQPPQLPTRAPGSPLPTGQLLCEHPSTSVRGDAEHHVLGLRSGYMLSAGQSRRYHLSMCAPNYKVRQIFTQTLLPTQNKESDGHVAPEGTGPNQPT